MIRVPVLTAMPGTPGETELVTALEQQDHGVRVVGRCVDLPELLSVAAAGRARAVLVSTGLAGLDVSTLARLSAAGVAVVGLVPAGDGQAEATLLRLGVGRVLPLPAGPAAVARAVIDAVAAGIVPAAPGHADPADALPVLPAGGVRVPAPARGRGRVLAVWGPTGAPGRTTVAIGVADEAARLGVSTLLVDADPYGGTIAQTLGLVDETAGLALACREASTGRLDLVQLARQARQLRPGFRLLTGIARADRWPELRPLAVRSVLEQARHLSALTVVDCGFCLEQDEELSYDTAAPRRNGVTLEVLAAADTVLCVGAADPVGLRRLIGALDELREALPAVVPRVAVNRVRETAVPGHPRREIAAALQRWAATEAAAYLPSAPAVVDHAMRTGSTLADVAPAAPLRRALAGLARDLTGVSEPAPRRRFLARR